MLRRLLLALAVAGCFKGPTDPYADDTSNVVVLTPTDSSFVAGNTARFHLRNTTTFDLSYNLCSGAFDRRSGTSWVEGRSDLACYTVIYILKAGADTTASVRVPTDLSAGSYALRATFGRMNGPDQAFIRRSSTFMVVRGAPSVTLTPIESTFGAGGTATFQLRNHEAFDFGYNLCDSRLQRWRNGAFVDEPQSHGCNRMLYILRAGVTQVASYPLGAELPPGTYRIQSTFGRVYGDGDVITRASEPFVVVR
jgi:hypothetical protein